ncbi:uncharacterized protein DUF1839 [Hoeflea marina]|uniref:Uncharacterized protein DUF1839 n=1 Tax=Hoeflea marina TaxID=274592 RepID=A0A317PGW9_9HYPH|nr:DUF1839 family protein [Hoeflea marina]PWV99186.1 uncharacterized protein DUF1839 [Hoeflea marina]
MQPILTITPSAYRPHALHNGERMWPETNCYTDLWIELLAAQGLPPEPMLGFTLTQDFEGDQMTFFKVPLEDLESLFGIKVTELAIYDRLEAHVAEQAARGRVCLVEMDSYYMPDTQGVAYRIEHGKTTVAINRLDLESRELDYFHNGGFFHLSGDDFDNLFQLNAAEDALPFLPYTEFAKFPATYPDEARLRAGALSLGRRHLNRRPAANPLRAFSAAFASEAARVADKPFGFFHKYAFNTLRQAGANFELCGSYFDWLGEDFTEPAGHALKISEGMKSAQFQLARAVTRRKFDALGSVLEPAADAWDQLMESAGKALA